MLVAELMTLLTMLSVSKGSSMSYNSSKLEQGFKWTESQLDSLISLVSDLSQLGNTETHLIADFSHTRDKDALLIKRAVLSRLEVPLFTYDLTWLEDYQSGLPAEPCPIFGTGHDMGHGEEEKEKAESAEYKENGQSQEEGGKVHINGSNLHETHPEALTKLYHRDAPLLHMRKPLLPFDNYYRSILVWVDNYEDIDRVYTIFNNTVMWCKQKKQVGIFNNGNRFYFLAKMQIQHRVFSFQRFRTHAHVSTIVTKGKENKFILSHYNFFTDQVVIGHVWTPSNPIKDIKNVFNSQKDFQNFHFVIATNPWSHHVVGDLIPESEGGNATMKYRNYWGYEIDLLEATSQILNFSYTIVNPADGKWGHIEADGSWSGLVAEAANGDVDFVICDVFIVYSRAQVIDGTIAFDKDYQAFASPQPQPLPKFLALVHPFTLPVWLSLLTTVFLVTFALWTISNAEASLTQHQLSDWSWLPRSLWYCYGTFIGESITRDTRSATANALRWVLGVWVLYCFILSTSYAGNLKAFLTTPEYTKPINTLAEVLDSGLPWKMVLYGEEEEEMMANSEDYVIKTIWDKKIEEEYAPFPKIEKVFEGDEVFIDWKSGLEPAIFSRYSTPRGDPLIHKSPNPVFMPNFPGWAFHIFNPWRPRFDTIIRRTMEAGFIDQWTYRTWVKIKENNRKEMPPITLHDKEAITPLSLDHLQSVFYFCLLLLAFSSVFGVVEISNKVYNHHRDPNSTEKDLYTKFEKEQTMAKSKHARRRLQWRKIIVYHPSLDDKPVKVIM